MAIDINKINNIDTDLVTPTINENLIETERDKWGNILNEQTFKLLNNNIKILKEVLLEIANENNITNLDSIKLRLDNLEIDRDNIESIIDDNTPEELNIGKSDRVMNLITKDNLKINGEILDLNSNNNVSDSPFKEFESRSILRSLLPLEDGSEPENNETRLVTFNNVFTSIPFVFVNLVRDDKEFSILSIYNVTTTGFKLSLYYAGGDCQVQYIAFTLKD